MLRSLASERYTFFLRARAGAGRTDSLSFQPLLSQKDIRKVNVSPLRNITSPSTPSTEVTEREVSAKANLPKSSYIFSLSANTVS